MDPITKLLGEKKGMIDSIIRKYLPEAIDERFVESIVGKTAYQHDFEALNKALAEPIWDLLNRGGKRWRPALFLLITEALGGDVEKVKDFSVVPELLHSGSLIIDDIEDQGEMRRGKPCVHKIFGTDIAINAGNIMYFLPLVVFMRNKGVVSRDALLRAYEVYSQEMMSIHFGQGTDIHWHKGKHEGITDRQYLQMVAFKTGCLSRMAAKLAAVLAGVSEEKVDKIGKIGETIGIAFQIRDDVLSIVGEEFSKKKGYGDDITEGKRSLPVIHALQKADNADRERLLEILGMHTTDRSLIREAIGIVMKYGGPEYSMDLAEGLVKETWAEIDPIFPESDAKNSIKAFFDYLISRDV